MKYLAGALSAAALLSSAPAIAGEEILYEPAPAWIEPAAIPEIRQSPPIILYDDQRRIEEGRLWTYVDRAFRIDNPQMLTAVGTVQAMWQPDKGDLIVHQVAILRDGAEIDVLGQGARFDVLRRERQLEQRMIDGAFTATLAVPGLRVGDVLRVSYSATLSDQALDKEVQVTAMLPAEPFDAGFARLRVSWPEGSDVSWRASDEVEVDAPVVENGFATINVALPLPEADEMPNDAPWRYRMPPVFQAGTFADWREVSRVMGPIFATEGTIEPGGAIAREVERIEAEHSGELERAIATLRLVQDKISYLLNGMNGGNYIPQTPAETWENRFGDCKAKTLLLLAMLREMGIESEAVVVASATGDAVPEMLPMPAAFDHVIVRAVIDGEQYWFDGTSSGASRATVGDVPPFHYALPLREGGSDLIAMPQRPQESFDQVASITYDFTAGLDLPALFEAEWTLSGAIAAPFSGMIGQVNDDQMHEWLTQFVVSNLGATQVLVPQVHFDRNANVANITAKGVIRQSWDWEGNEGSRTISLPSSDFEFAPDRSRAEWQDIPVVTFGPYSTQTSLTILLPEADAEYVLDGRAEFDTEIANAHLTRDARLDGHTLTVVDSVAYLPGELDRDEIREERFKLARFGPTELTLRAPISMERRWQYADAHDDPKLVAIEEAYTADIEREPESMRNHADRGNFRWYIYDFAGAVEDYTRALTLQATPELYNDRGWARTRLGDYSGAVDDYRESYILEPTPTRTLALAQALILDQRLSEARELLEGLSAERSVQQSVQISLADIEALQGDASSGLDRLDAMLATNPLDPIALNAKCWYLAAWQLRTDDILPVCTLAVENAPYPAAALDSRALAHLRRGDINDALRDVERAMELNPAQEESLLLRGLILRAKGDPRGEIDISAALARDPSIAPQYRKFGFEI